MEPLFAPDLHVFYEHTMIPLAIYYMEDGKFRTYLVSDGAAKMYESTPEEMMARLNSDDPFVNIVEKDEMIRAVNDFSENDTPYNVVFHEYVGKNRKLITVHGVGSHEYTRDGRRYSVIRYDEISDSSRRCLFRDEEKAIAERERLLYEIDDAIARSYTSVVYVDMEKRKVHAVRLNRHGRILEGDIDSGIEPHEVMDSYVRSLVYRDDAEGVRRFGDLDLVMELLKETNPIYHTYRTIRDGRIVYYRLKIIPFDNGKKLAYGFEYFDDQVREQLARKNEYDTQMTLLAGLSCEYRTVWLVDAAIHHVKLIRVNSDIESSLSENKDTLEGNYETLTGNYIDRFVVPEDRERMYLEASIDNLMRNTKESEIYHVNYGKTNPEGGKNYFQLCVSRVTDESGVVRFVCGIRNIDAIIEEEKNRNMLYSMAHIDHMTNINNRRTFDEYMDSVSDTKPDKDVVFFSFDLNDLKEANDSHGHEAGDELIIGAADCMRTVLAPYGNIYRIGGDEFAAVITIAPEKRAALFDRMKESFDGWKGKLYPSLSISMGYVCASEDPGFKYEDMRREAEKRMYAQKADHYMKEGYDRRRSRSHDQ